MHYDKQAGLGQLAPAPRVNRLADEINDELRYQIELMDRICDMAERMFGYREPLMNNKPTLASPEPSGTVASVRDMLEQASTHRGRAHTCLDRIENLF